MAIHSKKDKAENEYQKAFKQSEERFRTLIQFSADAIQLISAGGHVLYSSDSVEHVLGYKPEELQGVSPRRLYPSRRSPFLYGAIPVSATETRRSSDPGVSRQT